MQPIQTKLEIVSALQESSKYMQEWYSSFSAKEYFARHGEVWSASDNVDHLIKAIKPIAKALGLSKLALHAMFGKPDRSSKSYEEICSLYRAEIAKGAVASGSFLPQQEDPADPEERKSAILAELFKAMDKLVLNIEKWDDPSLDEAQLPHPLLGNLTMREMLYFTVYHNLRHASKDGD